MFNNPPPLPGNLAYTDAANAFVQNQTLTRVAPSLFLNDTAQAVDARLFRLIAGLNGFQTLSLQALNDAQTISQGLVSMTRAGNVSLSGTLAINGAGAPNVARTDAANTFSGSPQTVSAAGPTQLRLMDTGQAANQRGFVLSDQNQRLYVAATDDAGAILIPTYFDRNGNFINSGDIYEKQRTTPIGHWIQIPYSGGNFSGNAGAWTVEAGDFNTGQYMLIGKTCFFQYFLLTTSLAVAGFELKIALPAGVMPASYLREPFNYGDAGVAGIGAAIIGYNDGYVRLWKDLNSGANWAAQTNTLNIALSLVFPII